MGTSAKYISLLRMAAEAIALDPMLPGNVPVMMTSALHVYCSSITTVDYADILQLHCPSN